MMLRVACLASSLLFACGGNAPKPSQDPVAIGRRLAESSKDWQAHRDLARLRLKDGFPGEALREFLLLERLERLSADDRRELSRLLVNRSKERLALRDPAALSDLDHARALGAVADTSLLGDVIALAAVTALRHSSAYSRAEADAHLQRLATLRGDDIRVQHHTLEGLSLAELLVLLEWFNEAGARRQALRVAQTYVERGGRQPQALLLWLTLHRWWYGDQRTPVPREALVLSPEIASSLEEFGVQLHEEGARQNEGGAAELAEAWSLSAWRSDLRAVEDSLRVDPALADRRAREFVDREVYGASKIAALAELFYRLGEYQRSQAWTLELAELSPSMPSFLLAAGLGWAVTGEVERAEPYFTAAAAASGDPGRYWSIAARSLRLAGHPLAAVSAGRRALSLTAPGQDLMILLEVSRAQSALGRSTDAGRSLEALLQRVPESARASALRMVDAAGRGEPEESARRPAFLESLRPELGL